MSSDEIRGVLNSYYLALHTPGSEPLKVGYAWLTGSVERLEFEQLAFEFLEERGGGRRPLTKKQC